MAESMSRELILPARRLDVPPRPSERQVAAIAERSADVWSATPREWATQQVVRLAIAALLAAQAEKSPDVDPETSTLADLARTFRPHVPLAPQAMRAALVEAVNAGVPAAADPLRDALRRLGVTGREPLVMVALGLDRVPADDKEFWTTVRTSTTLTAVVDALASGGHRVGDMTKLDRRQLARADALVLAAGKVTPVAIGSVPSGGGSWLPVPIALTRPRRRAHDEQRGKNAPAEIVLRADGWTEVFETALDAVSAAMQQADGGHRGRGRTSAAVESLAQRLGAARKRTVADVVASLRAIDPFVLEMFDHQVATADVRIAVPVLEDDSFARLWLSPEALAAPLVTGAADLFFGGRAEPRPQGGPGGRPDASRRGRPERRPERGERPDGKDGGKDGGRGSRGGRGGRGPKGRAQDAERTDGMPVEAPVEVPRQARGPSDPVGQADPSDVVVPSGPSGPSGPAEQNDSSEA